MTGSQEPAGERLTRTPELMEMILLDVDIQTLLLSQRTSRGFLFAIRTSPKLQRKLFFTLSTKQNDPKSGTSGPFNPLLTKGCDDFGIESYDTETGCIREVNFVFTETQASDPTLPDASWRHMYLSIAPQATDETLINECEIEVHKKGQNSLVKMGCTRLEHTKPVTMEQYRVVALRRFQESLSSDREVIDELKQLDAAVLRGRLRSQQKLQSGSFGY